MDKISFSVQMKTSYMFRFLYVNSYSGARGIVNYSISLAGLLALIFDIPDDLPAKVVCIIIACMFTIIDPLILFTKGLQQVKLNPVFKQPINYTFSVENFTVGQNGENAEAPWDMVLLAKETRGLFILFTPNKNAIILPKSSMEGQEEDMYRILSLALPEDRKQLKKRKNGNDNTSN